MSTPHLRDILADNIRRRIDADSRAGAKQSVRAWALSRGLNVRMIDRLIKGQHAVTLDTLDELAKPLGLQPWQLLLPDLPATGSPKAPLTDDERALLTRLQEILERK